MFFGKGKNQLKIPAFRGEKKKYYDSLMTVREKFSQQLDFHSGEALKVVNSAGETGMSTHMADLGSDNFLHDMELAMITTEGNILELIDEAIHRLIKNEYGKCLDCTAEINPERLKALPYAMFCIKCKTVRENNNGMPTEQE